MRFNQLQLWGMIGWLSLAAWGQAAAPNPPAMASASRAVCLRLSACRGPKLQGRHFSLLILPRAGLSVAAARRHWGDYDKILLLLTNFGQRVVAFHPSRVRARAVRHHQPQAWLLPVQVSIINPGPQGAGINFGQGPGVMIPPVTSGPDSGTNTPVPTSPQARQVLGQDPLGAADARLESARLRQMRANLRPALHVPLGRAWIRPKVILAGYLIVPRPRHGHLRQVQVTLGGIRFQLPLH